MANGQEFQTVLQLHANCKDRTDLFKNVFYPAVNLQLSGD